MSNFAKLIIFRKFNPERWLIFWKVVYFVLQIIRLVFDASTRVSKRYKSCLKSIWTGDIFFTYLIWTAWLIFIVDFLISLSSWITVRLWYSTRHLCIITEMYVFVNAWGTYKLVELLNSTNIERSDTVSYRVSWTKD